MIMVLLCAFEGIDLICDYQLGTSSIGGAATAASAAGGGLEICLHC